MSESIFNNAIYLDDVPKSDWKNYIGNGYRSVCYTTDQNKHGKIIFFGFDKNDEPKTFICPWQSYIKYNVKYETSERDIYDHYVATKYFNSKYERDQYVKNANGINIVECLKPESEFLHFMFDENVLDMNFNKQPLRLHYFDIETEISDKFEKPTDARNRINMMTIYDSLTEKFYTWSLQKCSLNFETEPIKDYPKDMFVIFDHFHNDELAMLEHFLSWMEDNYADISITYNGKAYDMPYLVRRIENTLGKNHAKRLSPVGRYFIKEVNHDNERADVSAEIEVNISGLFIADCLLLYRDKFQIGGSLDGGFSLDNVGEHEGCGNKIKYEGTLKDLYLNDWQRFYEYNIRDVDLLKRLDDKCKMIQLARQITSFGLADYNQIYGSIAYLIGSVISFSKPQM
jgi:DNA polymerase elongation subunit (family B)